MIKTEDGAKLGVVMWGQSNRVGTIFARTHRDEKERQGFETMCAFKVETKATSSVFNGTDRSTIDLKDKFTDRVKTSQVELGRRPRNEAFDTAATKQR